VEEWDKRGERGEGRGRVKRRVERRGEDCILKVDGNEK
jgi:hypothetical protein